MKLSINCVESTSRPTADGKQCAEMYPLVRRLVRWIQGDLMFQEALPLPGDPVTVAVVTDATGKVIDECWGWEAGQSYAQQGYFVKAINDDGRMLADDAQRMYDYERTCFLDCFGHDETYDPAKEAA